MIKIGVLALQGSVQEHLRALFAIPNVEPCEVKNAKDLNSLSGLILPGGESTTMGKLMNDFGLKEPLIEKAMQGLPLWGTCAGMILLAKEIVHDRTVHLGLMDITVRRNAYGSQMDSFHAAACIPTVSENAIPLVFIRAPWVERVGKNVTILSEMHGKIIAVHQDHLLATAFHPELTDSLAFHEYFVNRIIASRS